MPLPLGWDWAARSLEFTAPDPLFRGIVPGSPRFIPTVAQASDQPPAERGPETRPQKESTEPIRYFPLGVEVVETESPLRLPALPPQAFEAAEDAQPASFSKGPGEANPSAEPCQTGFLKGQGGTRFLGDHWLGVRRPEPTSHTPLTGKHKGSPGAQPPGYSRWNDWND